MNDLFDNPYWWGQRIADHCYRKGWRTAYGVAFCYNGGPRAKRSKVSARRYARQIAEDHAERRLAMLWKGRR